MPSLRSAEWLISTFDELVECPTSDSRHWFLFNFKTCSIPLALGYKLSGITTVALEELKTGAHLDRRVCKDVASIDSSFGVVSAILRQKCSNQAKETRTAGWLVSCNRPFFSDVQRRVIPVDKCFIFFPVRRG